LNDNPFPFKNYDPQRFAELLEQQRFLRFRGTDRMFAGLMLFQWLAGIVIALTVSPRTWIGDTPSFWAASFPACRLFLRSLGRPMR